MDIICYTQFGSRRARIHAVGNEKYWLCSRLRSFDLQSWWRINGLRFLSEGNTFLEHVTARWRSGGRWRHAPLLLGADVLWRNPTLTGRFLGAVKAGLPYPISSDSAKCFCERFRQRRGGVLDIARGRRRRFDISCSGFMSSVKTIFTLRDQKYSQLKGENTQNETI
jgi:hypothetical protein